ncbi:hypothetical protein H072_9122 [Dactylellina haptotyla CBS 200.50]|uniref:Uncharacterized protein n=1 Tax=Dactylellina haptotyla (strain CBS 200.50) TaxID=1284197 RepID=S8A2H9_DACHA|nr:hypothetical protein H072_9122 [Dactylellina haptotyla CBS 200.50]
MKYCSEAELPKLVDAIRNESTIEHITEYIEDKLERSQYVDAPYSHKPPAVGNGYELPGKVAPIPQNTHSRHSSIMRVNNIIDISPSPILHSPRKSTITEENGDFN